LESVKITTSQYNAWLRDPTFSNYLKQRAEAMYTDATPIAMTALLKAMQNGDMQAVKMFFEMNGRYAKNINLNLNVESVMNRVVEIIIRHVDDQEVLDAIATDIQELLSGQT
jgi:hypothetical protein